MQTKTLFVGGSVTLVASGYLTTTSTNAALAVGPTWEVDEPTIVSIDDSGATCVCIAESAGVAIVTCSSGALTAQTVQITVVDPDEPADTLNVTIT